MVNPNNDRKKEHFDLFEDIMNNTLKLAIVIGLIVLIIVIIYVMLTRKKTGMMSALSLSDTSPMAPLTATPAM